MSLFLNEDELYELTGFRQRKQQKLALAELSVPFRSRPADGYPLVARIHFEQTETPRKKTRPDFEAALKAG